MVIDDKDGDDDDTKMEEDVAGTAYRETMTSADGFTRGPNGRVKFNKDTKKRRREADEGEDVEMADAEAAGRKPEKRRAEPKFGHEFKAKVSTMVSFGRLILTKRRLRYRKPVATSRRTVSTRTLTSRCPKRRKRRDVVIALELQAEARSLRRVWIESCHHILVQRLPGPFSAHHHLCAYCQTH